MDKSLLASLSRQYPSNGCYGNPAPLLGWGSTVNTVPVQGAFNGYSFSSYHNPQQMFFQQQMQNSYSHFTYSKGKIEKTPAQEQQTQHSYSKNTHVAPANPVASNYLSLGAPIHRSVYEPISPPTPKPQTSNAVYAPNIIQQGSYCSEMQTNKPICPQHKPMNYPLSDQAQKESISSKALLPLQPSGFTIQQHCDTSSVDRLKHLEQFLNSFRSDTAQRNAQPKTCNPHHNIPQAYTPQSYSPHPSLFHPPTPHYSPTLQPLNLSTKRAPAVSMPPPPPPRRKSFQKPQNLSKPKLWTPLLTPKEEEEDTSGEAFKSLLKPLKHSTPRVKTGKARKRLHWAAEEESSSGEVDHLTRSSSSGFYGSEDISDTIPTFSPLKGETWPGTNWKKKRKAYPCLLPSPKWIRKGRKDYVPRKSAASRDAGFRGICFRMRIKFSLNLTHLSITAVFNYPQKHISSWPDRGINLGNRVTSTTMPPKIRGHANAGKQCASCSTRKTPLWRDAEDGTPLCNACGIRYKKYRLRCSVCWYIPRKDSKIQTVCKNCGEALRVPVIKHKTW